MGRRILGLVVVVGLMLKAGCGLAGDFLGLEDYQRDLLGFGALAAWILQNPLGGAAGDPAAAAAIPGPEGGRGVPGADGADGSDGPQGAAGLDGEAGPAGDAGGNCWDVNGNGLADMDTEDLNGDGTVDVLDCLGADGVAGGAGAPGPAGPKGDPGVAGPSFFGIFIDDFFGPEPDAVTGDLKVTQRPGAIRIKEPTLGRLGENGETPRELAFRIAVPDLYDVRNAITMRLFLQVSGTSDGGCFVFSVDRARLRDRTSIERYDDTRYVRVDGTSKTPVTQSAADLLGADLDSILAVVDLPINIGSLNEPCGRWLGGLGFWVNDVFSRDFLAFELRTARADGRLFHLLGVELFETDSPKLHGASIFANFDPEGPCVDLDCNANGLPDSCDIETGTSLDCQRNGIPDECDGGCGDCVCPDDLTVSCEGLQGVAVDYQQPQAGDCRVFCPVQGDQDILYSLARFGDCIDRSGDCDGDDLLRVIDRDSAATITRMPITFPGPGEVCLQAGHGLATNPLTGDLWALLTLIDGGTCEDANRTVFAGCPGTEACRQFFAEPNLCEQAWHIGENGAASCWFDDQTSECRGCGPSNEGQGSCVNTCVPQPPTPTCEDANRTNFVGGPGNEACRSLTDQTSCEFAYHRGETGVASCYWDGQSCQGCGWAKECAGSCQNTCGSTLPTLVCEGDPSRTNFAGCPRTDACRSLADRASCEVSYHLGRSGIASCFWDEQFQSCVGCGPANAGCSCTNTCDASGQTRGEFAPQGRELVAIDPLTGVARRIGNTGDRFAGLAFDAGGVLYGVTGDGACDPEALFMLSTMDATPTRLGDLGNGTNGETIAFNPDNGLLYHASGKGQRNIDRILETVNPENLAVAPITLSGVDYNEARGLTYEGDGNLLLAANDLYRVTTDGVTSFVGFMDHTSKGLAFVRQPACRVACDPPPGSVFPIGQSQVECIAVPLMEGPRGLAGNPICSFAIDVTDECLTVPQLCSGKLSGTYTIFIAGQPLMGPAEVVLSSDGNVSVKFFSVFGDVNVAAVGVVTDDGILSAFSEEFAITITGTISTFDSTACFGSGDVLGPAISGSFTIDNL